MRVKAYRESKGLAVIDTTTKQPVPRSRRDMIALRTCRVGHDERGLFVEGEQLAADVPLRVDLPQRLAVRLDGQWRVVGLTPALVSARDNSFYRLAPGVTDPTKARPLYVCEWAFLPDVGGLVVSYT